MAEKGTDVESACGQIRPLPVRGQCASLGLFCFGLTTMLGMSVPAGWTEESTTSSIVQGYALFYGGAAQVIAGVLELIRGNSMGGTAFVSFGAFWMGDFFRGAILQASAPPAGMSFNLALWGTLAAVFLGLSLKRPLLVQLVFSSQVVAFALLAAGVQHRRVNQAGGYFGFLCGFLAFYTGIAELVMEEYSFAVPGYVVWYKPKRLTE